MNISHYLEEIRALTYQPSRENFLQLIKFIKKTPDKYLDTVLDYIVRIVNRTRNNDKLRLGASPRGSLDLRRCAQAAAFLNGHSEVRPDDVQKLAVAVLGHRLIVEVKALHGGLTAEMVVDEIVNSEPIPA